MGQIAGPLQAAEKVLFLRLLSFLGPFFGVFERPFR
jgi:hypothetical protein